MYKKVVNIKRSVYQMKILLLYLKIHIYTIEFLYKNSVVAKISIHCTLMDTINLTLKIPHVQ
jgi:hypothetical protein